MKKNWLLRRIKFAIKNTPKRFVRLWTFYRHPFYRSSPFFPTFIMLLSDLLFVFDVYEILAVLIKKNTRPLKQVEQLRGYGIFAKNIDYQIVMIDEKAKLVCKDRGIIYVSFCTINSWGNYPDDILIHELTHIWQYQQFGAGYIVAALQAQRTQEGYNYAFTEGWHLNDSILNFNAEQQADLIQDFYRIKKGLKPQWANDTGEDYAYLTKFNDEITNRNHVTI